jgi:hypothetical protein
MRVYALCTNEGDPSEHRQSEQDQCFAGGQPRLLSEMALPKCHLCSADLSFFFQIAFPQGHVWEGFTLAVFACTDHGHEDQLLPIPIRVPGTENVPATDIRADYFMDYEQSFRYLVFPTHDAVRRHDYVERVKFRRWELSEVDPNEEIESYVGGEPQWYYDPPAEFPVTYASRIPVVFLMQLKNSDYFPTHETAPSQEYLVASDSLTFTYTDNLSDYSLFYGTQLYFFGIEDGTNRRIFVARQ